MFGEGVPQDFTKAAYWFTKAAEQGNVYAQSNLGLYYDKGEGVPQDKEKAVYCYTKAAEQGNVNGQNALGVIYHKGEGVPQDFAKAVYWYTKAAEQDYVLAQYNLGNTYFFNKNGVPQDKEKAVYWYTKAAEQGHAEAQYNLGTCYMNGNGVPKDMQNAKYWYTKAAAQGYESAKKNLSVINSNTSRGGERRGGCYVATCVYGSYDCPEVWTLRRYRDNKLSASWLGRRFIRFYYAVSPKIVALFGNKKWFNRLWKPVLNKLVCQLQKTGIDSSPYSDTRPIMAETEKGGK
jgi:TPR repeat protein